MKTTQPALNPRSVTPVPGRQTGALAQAAQYSPATQSLAALQRMADQSPVVQNAVALQRMEEDELQGKFIQRAEAPKANNTGLPDNLKYGIESLSGMSMDHVQVHRNSDKPAAVQAHAYAQGSDIHLRPGQEKHLPHEAWHVVQQAQGRVKPTMQLKGVAVNDDAGLEAEADVMGAKALQAMGRLEYSSNSPQKTPATGHAPLQRMVPLADFAKFLATKKQFSDLSEYYKDRVLYWNSRDVFDGLSGQRLIDEVFARSRMGFEDVRDEADLLAGQTHALLELPEFMQDHYEFDLPLPLGIGTLSFRHGHQYVLGTDYNKWISNNILWAGGTEEKKFSYMIHVILQFSGSSEHGWAVDPHVTIRNEQEQLKQTGVAFISDTAKKTAVKKANPEMEATRASYSLGLGTAKRKPGSNMGVLPDDYIDDNFKPWLAFVRDKAVPLNQIEDEGIGNRRQWMEFRRGR